MTRGKDAGARLTFLLVPAFGIVLVSAAWFYFESTGSSSGTVTEPQVLEKTPVPHQVAARLLFDGKPILDRTQRQPSVWVRNEDTGQAAEIESWYENGVVMIGRLGPGSYGVQVTIDDNTSNTVNHPGDYYSWTPFKVEKGRVASVSVDLRKVMHMTSPEDNNSVMEGWEEEGCEPRALFSSKELKFAWDPVGVGVLYDYTVERIACPYRFLGRLAEGTTEDTRLVLDLPASPPGEFYIFNLHARHDDRQVGVLMTWGPDFLAWDYRFRVK